MFSFFAPKNCNRCSGELAEVDKQLIDLKAENQRLRQSLAQASTQKPHSEKPFADEVDKQLTELRAENQSLHQSLAQIRAEKSHSEILSVVEVEKQLAELEVENQRLRQSLAHTRIENQRAQTSFVKATPKVVYIASWSRKHFHRPSCVWMENLPQDKIREFTSHEEAVNAGYRPCKTCCA